MAHSHTKSTKPNKQGKRTLIIKTHKGVNSLLLLLLFAVVVNNKHTCEISETCPVNILFKTGRFHLKPIDFHFNKRTVRNIKLAPYHVLPVQLPISLFKHEKSMYVSIYNFKGSVAQHSLSHRFFLEASTLELESFFSFSVTDFPEPRFGYGDVKKDLEKKANLMHA